MKATKRHDENDNQEIQGNLQKMKSAFAICQIFAITWFFTLYLRYCYVAYETDRPNHNVTHTLKSKNLIERFKGHNFQSGIVEMEKHNDVGKITSSTRTISTIELLSKRFCFESDPLLPHHASCRDVVEGIDDAVGEAALLGMELRSNKHKYFQSRLKHVENVIMNMTDNCTEFILKRNYITTPLSLEEKAYPIAYVITMHDKFLMFERLLRAIYHPQNIYCIHVDKKSSGELLEAVKKLSSCFPNVFVASKLIEVHYAHWSRVEADISCFEDLVNRSVQTPWKYVINLCGQDFPLKTNLDIVRLLKSFHGYNNMETVAASEFKKQRYEFQYELVVNSGGKGTIIKTSNRKTSSPLDTPIFVGSAYNVWKREAVEFIITDPRVAEFLEWSKDTYSPDEHIWATLQRWYPHVPGSIPSHEKYNRNELQSHSRVVKWEGLDKSVYPKCSGLFRRGVCVYGVGDLSWLLQQHHLFANKFDYDVDPYAIECLDVWLRNRTLLQSYIYHTKGFV